MQLALAEIDSGKTAITPMSLDAPSNGKASGAAGGASDITTLTAAGPAPTGEQALDGAGGFLWKPEAEKDGKLVVILPSSFTGNATKLEIHKSLPATEETKVEEGSYAGVGNEGREHFRFSQSGGSYGDNLYVVATNADGTQASWKVDDGAKRTD